MAIFLIWKIYGGEGGIRTHGTLSRTAVFKTAALNHSATSPHDVQMNERHVWSVLKRIMLCFVKSDNAIFLKWGLPFDTLTPEFRNIFFGMVIWSRRFYCGVT